MASADIVIDRHGKQIADAWITIEPEAPLPEQGAIILPLARLIAEPNLTGRADPLGVVIGPDEDLATLVPMLPKLDLVAVAFPKFRDGRGFTQIRALRERHSFNGDIRAVGHPLPDQFLNLNRCGATSVRLPEGQDPAVWAGVLALHGGLDTRPVAEQPLPLLRRLAVPFGTE
jgi:uncharacterized protein (DUF934 family)